MISEIESRQARKVFYRQGILPCCKQHQPDFSTHEEKFDIALYLHAP